MADAPTPSTEAVLLRTIKWSQGPFGIIVSNAGDPNDDAFPMIITSDNGRGFDTPEAAEEFARIFLQANDDTARFSYCVTAIRTVQSHNYFLKTF